MLLQQSFQAQNDASEFGDFLNAAWSSLRSEDSGIPEALPTGLGDVLGERYLVSYATDLSLSFAALQWTDSQPAPGAARRVEVFFSCPTKKSPRSGVCVVFAAEDRLHPPEPPSWWTVFAPNAVPSDSLRHPSFMQLAALLASDGQTSVTNGLLLAEIDQRDVVIDHYKSADDRRAAEMYQLRLRLQSASSEAVHSGENGSPNPVLDTSSWSEESDYSRMADWADLNSGRITILPRALNGCKKARYANPGHLYAALEFLAGPYRDARCGRLGKAELDAALAASGVQLRGSTTVPTLFGDTYFVSYAKRRCVLDMHLVRGGGRDERYCLRVYFFWDDVEQKAVVGWMPSHLENTLA